MNKILKIVSILIIIGIPIFLYSTKNSNIEKYLNDEYTAKYKINDLYNSKEINYRIILDNNERSIYDEYIKKIINFDNKFDIDMSKFNYTNPYLLIEKFKKVNQALIMDHPEIIYFAYPSMSTTNNKILHVNISYVLNKKEYLSALNMMKKQIEEIKQKTNNLSDYEKIKYVYEYLGYKNNYGSIDMPMSQSAFSAFNDELSPVCAGYARASQIIFQNIGINSFLISGILKSNWFSGDAHEWNIVKLEDKYYNFDVTQSSIAKNTTKQISYYGLLNKNKSSLSPSNKQSALNIDGYKYDYYKLNNLEYTYKSDNIEELKNILDNNKSKYVELRINNSEIFKIDFNKLKNELKLKSYIIIDDIIILVKN